MRFADIIGQDYIKDKLRKIAESGRISHAQLFTGEYGSGTLALALAYAQYINCRHRHDGDSCGECPDCVQIGGLAHPDLHFLFPVNRQGKKSGDKILSDDFLPAWREQVLQTGGYFNETMWNERLDLGKTLKAIISLPNANEMVRKLSYKSFSSEYKIVLIWQPETMVTEASNSLLKILEEPWDKTLFLLVSRQPGLLLPTIVSRTQEIPVPRIGIEDLSRKLMEETGCDEDRARILARLSEGNLIEARRLASGNDETSAANFEMFCSLMRLSYSNRIIELMEWAESFSALTRERQIGFFSDMLRLLRESYLLHAGMSGISYLWGDEATFCRNFSPFVGNHNIERLVIETERARSQIVQNGNSLIVMTHFVLIMSKLIVKI